MSETVECDGFRHGCHLSHGRPSPRGAQVNLYSHLHEVGNIGSKDPCDPGRWPLDGPAPRRTIAG